MIKTKQLLILVIFPVLIFAQNPDSLFSRFRSINESVETRVKCGFGLVNNIKQNYDSFTFKQKSYLNSVLDRPTLSELIISPKGYFAVHYSMSGVDSINYEINEFLSAADSAYDFEVNTLGYGAPPVDNDGYYHVYIKNSGGLYGYTSAENPSGENLWTSYIVLDNKFGAGFATHGINAARVTIAHEFHHAIQMGLYAFQSKDVFYHELTSTAMEEFNFDYVNDYHAYMSSYFNNPGNALPSNNGYNIAIWNIYLKERFDFDILKRAWELIRDNKRAMEAISLSISENGSTFQYEMNNFGIWTYFTGSHAKAGKYFKDAKDYPKIRPTTTIEFLPPQKQIAGNFLPSSNNFYLFPDYSRGSSDTLVTILTNGDVQMAITSPSQSTSVDYTLTSSQNSGFNKINDYYYSKIESPKKSFLSERNIFNNSENPAIEIKLEINYAYPQPFKYVGGNLIYIPAPKNTSTNGELVVFSSSMKLVYDGTRQISNSGNTVITWNGLDNNNQKLASGVYLFTVKAGNDIKKGKFVIINE